MEDTISSRVIARRRQLCLSCGQNKGEYKLTCCKSQHYCLECCIQSVINSCVSCGDICESFFPISRKKNFHWVQLASEKIWRELSDCENHNLYECLKTYISMVKYSNGKEIDYTIKKIWKSYFDCCNLLPLLTIDQSHEILSLFNSKKEKVSENSCLIVNTIVAMTVTPWLVDVAIGSHGVCYHGNMGETPFPWKSLRILVQNKRHLLC